MTITEITLKTVQEIKLGHHDKYGYLNMFYQIRA
jgi:hypothetical protein